MLLVGLRHLDPLDHRVCALQVAGQLHGAGHAAGCMASVLRLRGVEARPAVLQVAVQFGRVAGQRPANEGVEGAEDLTPLGLLSGVHLAQHLAGLLEAPAVDQRTRVSAGESNEKSAITNSLGELVSTLVGLGQRHSSVDGFVNAEVVDRPERLVGKVPTLGHAERLPEEGTALGATAQRRQRRPPRVHRIDEERQVVAGLGGDHDGEGDVGSFDVLVGPHVAVGQDRPQPLHGRLVGTLPVPPRRHRLGCLAWLVCVQRGQAEHRGGGDGLLGGAVFRVPLERPAGEADPLLVTEHHGGHR